MVPYRNELDRVKLQQQTTTQRNNPRACAVRQDTRAFPSPKFIQTLPKVPELLEV